MSLTSAMVQNQCHQKKSKKSRSTSLKYQLCASLCLIQNSQFKGTLNSKYNTVLNNQSRYFLNGCFSYIYPKSNIEALLEISLDTNMFMRKTSTILAPPDSHSPVSISTYRFSNGRYSRDTRDDNQVFKHETA